MEFAEQLQHKGLGLLEAAIEAAKLRLRPILMTSIAFILGVLPLVFATGAGSAGRHSVGTTVFGGMIVSTFLNLFIIPVLYIVVRQWLPMSAKQHAVADRLARLHARSTEDRAGSGVAPAFEGAFEYRRSSYSTALFSSLRRADCASSKFGSSLHASSIQARASEVRPSP